MGVKFDRMKDGYNRHQVDALIEELNMHISSLERSNEAYRNRCAQLEEQVSAMGKGGDSPVEHLREKEDAASQMVAIAMKEANTIVACSMSSSACLFQAQICWINEKAKKKTCPLTKSTESRWLVKICGAGERESLWSRSSECSRKTRQPRVSRQRAHRDPV